MSWPGGQGDVAPIFSISSDFQKFYCFVGKFSDFAVVKYNGFELYWRIFELGSPYSTDATTPLHCIRNVH